jgi:hypothetical protein
MINIDQLAAAVPHFAAAARASGTAPRAFFTTSATGAELVADSALVAKVDAVLATSGLKRREPGSFAPGGFAGVKAPADSNTPRVTGEGCIFCEWA